MSYRSIAGTLELFLGAYFVDFCAVMAILFFQRDTHHRLQMLAIAGMLFGALLVFRARRLLGWNRWVYWISVALIILVPLAWFIPALIRLK